MNLADWAESVGVNRHTAYRWFREGTLPVPAERVGRLILVKTAASASAAAAGVVLYARVSSHDRRSDLDRQTESVLLAAAIMGATVMPHAVYLHSGLARDRQLHWSVPMLVRRLITLGPALAILTLGFDPTRTLVLSQVVLSFGIPFAVLPLVKLTGSPAVMGGDTNHRATTWVGWVVAVMVSLLNVMLIYLTVTG